MAKRRIESFDNPQVEEVLEETVAPEVEEVEKKVELPTKGFVTLPETFKKLNLRAEPSTKGEVVTTLNPNTKVVINYEESTSEWYKVSVKNKLEGYCLKKYVTVKQ